MDRAEMKLPTPAAVTALALERYHGRHGLYLNSLQELVPEQLKTAPIDFMDGFVG
jgi:hypothetical protein